MPVYVDASLPVHPLTVDDLAAMVDAGILGEDDRVELLDGVLVEMSPQGAGHAAAIRRLNGLLVPFPATDPSQRRPLARAIGLAVYSYFKQGVRRARDG